MPKHVAQAAQRWNLSRADAPLDVRCHPADALPEGVNAHYGRWDWARVPCPPAQGAERRRAATAHSTHECIPTIGRPTGEEKNARRREAAHATFTRRWCCTCTAPCTA